MPNPSQAFGDALAGILGTCPPEPLFRALLESAPDALVITDQGGTILLINGEAERLFGFSRDEILGQNVEVLIPRRMAADHSEARRRYFTRPGVRPMKSGLDLRGQRKDGSEFLAEVSLSPVYTDAGVLAIATVRDVTERKLLEREALGASRLRNEILANMSHDLRTPLNAIIGFADLMRGGRVGPVSAEHREYLGDILTSARELLRLINEVVDLAKAELGTLELKREAADPGKIAAGVVEVLRAQAVAKRVRVEVQAHAGLSSVMADPLRLKQIIYSYVSNAIKFTSEKGTVTVRLSADGDDFFRVDVEDDGAGISAENVARVFVDFKPGGGAGLALTKRMVEAHGGRVEVRSTPGKGSVFSAVLPRGATGGGG